MSSLIIIRLDEEQPQWRCQKNDVAGLASWAGYPKSGWRAG